MAKKRGNPRQLYTTAVIRAQWPRLEEKHYPPKMQAVYVDTWMSLIGPILERQTFNDAHLMALAMLCELYVELDKLTKVIERDGATYESTHTKTGVKTIRERPENLARDRLLRSISRHMKLLGLFPTVKDVVGIKPPKPEGYEEWK